MNIAVRSGKDSSWKKIQNSTRYENNNISDIKELIYHNPDLVSSEDIKSGKREIMVCIKGSAFGDSDDNNSLIGISVHGKISIIQCKLPQGMGRALDYAAILWEMTYDEFNNVVLESEGRSLDDIMSEKAPQDSWNVEEFKELVSNSLKQGNFRLIIVVNDLNSELRKAIRFLTTRGAFSFEIYVLLMEYFIEGDVEIIVPRLLSFPKLSEIETSETTRINTLKQDRFPSSAAFSEDSERVEPIIADTDFDLDKPSNVEQSENTEPKENIFFGKCRENTNEVTLNLTKRLYNFSKETGDGILWWGSGGAGAFNFTLTEDALTVFIVDANGKIMFNFSEWQREPSYKDLLPQFLEKLKGINILRKQREDYTRWPDFSIEEFFAKPEDFKIFEDSIRFLKEELDKLAFI